MRTCRLLIVFCLLVSGCGIFFPETDAPSLDTGGPEGVVKELENSYEQKFLPRFESIIYSDSFRFYMKYDFAAASGFENIDVNKKQSVDVKGYGGILEGIYVYLDSVDEMRAHSNMFSTCSYIEMDIEVDSVEYGFPESEDDSSSAVVTTTEDTRIFMESDRLPGGALEYEVGKQVFFMKQNDEGEWGILYWFEIK